MAKTVNAEDDATKLPTFNCESFSVDENCEGKPSHAHRLSAALPHSRCVKLLLLALRGQWENGRRQSFLLTYVLLIGSAVISCYLSSASCVLTFLLVEYSLTARSIAPSLWGAPTVAPSLSPAFSFLYTFFFVFVSISLIQNL